MFLSVIAHWLGGCATPPQTQALLQQPVDNLPPAVELRDVPYYAQEIHQCGPATLAMTLNAAGAKTTPEQLAPQVYLPGREGSLQVEMLAATRRQGLLAYTLAPELHDLLREIAAGHPVLILQNLAFNWYPRWHYAVAIGYDLNARTITLRSGPDARQQLSLATFEYTWARSGKWAMLALPPTQVPITATAENYLNAALALEQTGQINAARTAYRRATGRWPDAFGAYIGLGNTAYALRDFADAAQAFRAATVHQPDSAIAQNNLADTLLQMNELDAALRYAQTAVWLGGDRQPAYAQTLAEIQNRIAAREAAKTTVMPKPTSSTKAKKSSAETHSVVAKKKKFAAKKTINQKKHVIQKKKTKPKTPPRREQHVAPH